MSTSSVHPKNMAACTAKMLIYSKYHANIWNATPNITPFHPSTLTPQPSPLTPSPSHVPPKHNKGALPEECTLVCSVYKVLLYHLFATDDIDIALGHGGYLAAHEVVDLG